MKKNKKFEVFAYWRCDDNSNCKKTKEKSFVALPHTLIMNQNFINLKDKTKMIYIYMSDYSNGLQTFNFPASVYEKIVSRQGFQNALKELLEYRIY